LYVCYVLYIWYNGIGFLSREPVRVRNPKPTTLTTSAELAERAAFLVGLQRKANVEEWLTRIIEERVELEEGAFTGAKRDLTARGTQ